MLTQIPHYLELGAEVLGAISGLATALSHLPLPARAASFLARIGIATSKFVVAKKAEP